MAQTKDEQIASFGTFKATLEPLNDPYAMEFKVWRDRASDFIQSIFGTESWQFKRFEDIDWYYRPSITWSDMDYATPTRETFMLGKRDAVALIDACLTDIEAGLTTDAGTPKVGNRIGRIFITHGTNEAWRQLQTYIQDQIKMPTLELSQQPGAGRTIIEKLEQESDKCGFAVIVMTGDNESKDGISQVRENVMHEIGWFQAKYGRSNVCLLHEEDVSVPTNISGIQYIPFPKGVIRAAFADLRQEIEHAYRAPK